MKFFSLGLVCSSSLAQIVPGIEPNVPYIGPDMQQEKHIRSKGSISGLILSITEGHCRGRHYTKFSRLSVTTGYDVPLQSSVSTIGCLGRLPVTTDYQVRLTVTTDYHDWLTRLVTGYHWLPPSVTEPGYRLSPVTKNRNFCW